MEGHADLVAKIYLRPPTSLKAEKLQAMTRGATSAMLEVAAWPIDVLVDERNVVRGFLMRKIANYEDLHELYSPKSRSEVFPEADFRFVVRVAINLARAFAYVHAQGHVIGDVNHGNAVIGRDGAVTLIDCDSFQARDRIKVYSCDVGVPLFTPPELQGQPYRGLRRSANHDAFGLAVLIFHLLFQGRHPYAGRYQQGELTIERAIAEHRFAYGSSDRTGMLPPPGTLPLDIFGAPIAHMFERAFEMSAAEGERPTAREWIDALEVLEAALVQCDSTPAHVHPSPDGMCCWCAFESRTGLTLFGKRLAQLGRDVAQEVEAAWHAIMAIDHPGPLPPAPSKPRAFSAQPFVAKYGNAFRYLARQSALIGAGVSLLAIVDRKHADLGFIGFIVSCAIFVATLETREDRKRRRSSIDRASKTWRALLARWHRECSSASFDGLLSQLHEIKLELLELARKRQEKRERIEHFHAHRSRRKFLEAFRIDQVSSHHLNRGQQRKLLSYGIATAADVDRKLFDLPNLLSAEAAEELLAWYRMHVRSYSGPVAAPTADELAALDDRFDHLEGRLLKKLKDGAAELQKKQEHIIASRERLSGPLQAAYDALSRAKVEQES